jgi:DNA-binding transcriptional regulator YiaG
LNINKALTDAISKGASKITRTPIAALRRDIAGLKREVAELRRHVSALQKGGQRKAVAAPDSEAETSTPTRIRPTGPMVRKLRARLGLTQVEFAKLAGVSGLTVSKWETAKGRITPRRRTLEALAKVKVMGKREAVKALAGE